MRSWLDAVHRRFRPAEPVVCDGHHWHYQSPITHGVRTNPDTGWACCHCPEWWLSAGRPPTSTTTVCAHLDGESEQLDYVEEWLDDLARVA